MSTEYEVTRLDELLLQKMRSVVYICDAVCGNVYRAMASDKFGAANRHSVPGKIMQA